MSQANSSVTQPVGQAPATDHEAQNQRENLIAARVLVGLALAVILLAVIILLFGLPALNIVGLIATLVVFVLLIAYATGF